MENVLIFGAGPGLGAAVARRFAREGYGVGVAARDVNRLEEMLPALTEAGAADARAFACDVGSPQFVAEAFREAQATLGTPRVVVYNVGAFVHKGIAETTADEFEHCWRVGCMGGFLVGQQAVQAMQRLAPRAGDGAQGTLIFTGATASLRGGARFHNLAVGKFGLRALAQSMAREFGPQGIHVAHAIIDGQIRAEHRGGRYSASERGDDALLEPDAIAESYWHLHNQPRNAWTHELDLRPWVEPF